VIESNIKTYGSSYVWAQLTIWWKQTVNDHLHFWSNNLQVDKPEATLTQERRGTLCYPSIIPSFVDLFSDKPREYEYPHKV